MGTKGLRKVVFSVGEWTRRYYPLLLILSVLVGAVFTPLLKGLTWLVPYVTALMIVSSASECRFQDFACLRQIPWAILVSMVSLYFVLPGIADFLSSLAFPGQWEMKTGFILFALLPVGVAASFWTSLAKGSIPLSLALTIGTSLISVFAIPISLKLLVGSAVELDAIDLFTSLLLMLLIPAVLTMTVGTIRPGWVEVWKPYAALGANLSVMFVVAVNMAVFYDYLHSIWNLVPLAAATMLLFIFILYALAYLAGRALHLERSVMTSILFSYGVRNNAFGMGVAVFHFSPLVSLPILMTIIFQQTVAAIVLRLLSGRRPGGWGVAPNSAR